MSFSKLSEWFQTPNWDVVGIYDLQKKKKKNRSKLILWAQISCDATELRQDKERFKNTAIMSSL